MFFSISGFPVFDGSHARLLLEDPCKMRIAFVAALRSNLGNGHSRGFEEHCGIFHPAADHILHEGCPEQLLILVLKRGFAHAHLMGGGIDIAKFVGTAVDLVADDREHFVFGIGNSLLLFAHLLLNFEEHQIHVTMKMHLLMQRHK